MSTKLTADIKQTGMGQGDLVSYLGNVRDVVNELQGDHDGDATHATNLKTLVNALRNLVLYMPFSNPAFAIKSNFDVQNANAVDYTNAGTLKTLSAAQTFDTGTSKVITADKWGAALLTLNSSGSPVVTFATANNYATEAAAIAGLALPDSTSTVLGYVTILTGSGVTWTAGTDALASGTGGNPATTTNYYNAINPNSLLFGAAVSTSPSAALTNSTALTLNKG